MRFFSNSLGPLEEKKREKFPMTKPPKIAIIQHTYAHIRSRSDFDVFTTWANRHQDLYVNFEAEVGKIKKKKSFAQENLSLGI